MKMKNTLTLLSVATLSLFYCLQVGSGQKKGDARRGVEMVDQQIMEAIKRGDAAALAALYTEEAKLMPPNSDFISGRKNIQDFWQATFGPGGVKQMKLAIAEVHSYGETAAEVGTYTVYDANDKVLEVGKYIVLWKKERGQWKLHHDLWSSNQPAR